MSLTSPPPYADFDLHRGTVWRSQRLAVVMQADAVVLGLQGFCDPSLDAFVLAFGGLMGARQTGLKLLLLGSSVLGGCEFEWSDPPPQREIGSAGVEVFRLTCMNLASQAYPDDLTGVKFAPLCQGTAGAERAVIDPSMLSSPRAKARLDALLANRGRLVSALDQILDAKDLESDELRAFVADFIPLYDPPAVLPELTREAARVLGSLVDAKDEVSNAAMQALGRMAPRDGYRPLREGLGLARSILSYPDIDHVVQTALESLAPKGSGHGAWQELLTASALDLATADTTPVDPKNPGSLAISRELLLATNPAYSSGRAPLLLAVRDYRGVVKVANKAKGVPQPFVDADGDGLADLDVQGRLVVTDGLAPTPFPTLDALLNRSDPSPRDADGRLMMAGSTPTYEYLDADKTLMAGIAREIGPLLLPTEEGKLSHLKRKAAVLEFAYGLSAVVGDFQERSFDFGKVTHKFMGPDTSKGPIFDLSYALGTVLPFKETEQLLKLAEVLVRDHERELAGLLEAALYIKERSDRYPDAKLEGPSDLWDDSIVWLQRVMKRPVAADGQNMLEALMRALTKEESAKLGTILGNFMRFKDPVAYVGGSAEELRNQGLDYRNVIGHLEDNAVTDAVQANREQLNAPCASPPRKLDGKDAPDSCRPEAPLPALNHQGIRPCKPGDMECRGGCPKAQPKEGASCATAEGFGLCSWDTGSCTCDCAGGLCLGDMTPTWHCSDASVPGYSSWVDRSVPDLSSDKTGKTNQSIFQRTLALINSLHVPQTFCNKDQASLVLYEPPGSNQRGLLSGVGGVLIGQAAGPHAQCALMQEQQVVQLVSRSIIGRGQIVIPPQIESVVAQLSGIVGTDLDTLFQRQTQIVGLRLSNVTPQAINRLVFGPYNMFTSNLLDPVAGLDQIPIADKFPDTMYAWEVKDPVAGMSMYTAITPLLEAFEDHELRDANGELLDQYMFAELIRTLHRHWPSRQSDQTARKCDETKTPPVCQVDDPAFAYQSNVRSYEDLFAEAMVDAKLFDRVRDVMVALDEIEVEPGVDGITVLTRATENLFSPTASCGGGDCVKNPLRARDGSTTTVTNTGVPIDHLTPMHIVFNAMNAIDARFTGDNEKRLIPWRDARSQIVDVLAQTDRAKAGDWTFHIKRARPIILDLIAFLRTRLGVYRGQEKECLAKTNGAGPCTQMRDWANGLTPRLERSLGQPVVAASLRLVDQLWDDKGRPGEVLLTLVHYLLQEGGAGQDDAFATTALSLIDMLQILEDSANTAPLMKFMSRAVAPNATEVAVSGKGKLDLERGATERALGFMRALQKIDPGTKEQPSTLAKLLRAAMQPTGKHGETPFEVLISVVAEVNRARPGVDNGRVLNEADFREVFRETQDFLSNDRHGVERLYDVVEARKVR